MRWLVEKGCPPTLLTDLEYHGLANRFREKAEEYQGVLGYLLSLGFSFPYFVIDQIKEANALKLLELVVGDPEFDG